MSWYISAKNKKKMTKVAERSHDQQEGKNPELGDVMRYTMDAYNCSLTLTRNNKRVSVAVLFQHSYLGSVIMNRFWMYGPDELDKAKKTFNKINDTISDAYDLFINEEIPTSNLLPLLMNRFKDIDPKGIVQTNNPNINYSYRYESEPDWRSTIYGTKYPGYNEKSFEQTLPLQYEMRKGVFTD